MACQHALVFTSHSGVQRSPACTDTASCHSSAHNPPQSCTQTHKRQVSNGGGSNGGGTGLPATDLLDGTLSGQGQLEQDTACPSRLLLPRKPPWQRSQCSPAVLC